MTGPTTTLASFVMRSTTPIITARTLVLYIRSAIIATHEVSERRVPRLHYSVMAYRKQHYYCSLGAQARGISCRGTKAKQNNGCNIRKYASSHQRHFCDVD